MPSVSSRIEKRLLKKLTSSAKFKQMVKNELSKTRKKSSGRPKKNANASLKKITKSSLGNTIHKNYASLEDVMGDIFDLEHIQNMTHEQLKEIFTTLESGMKSKDMNALSKVAELLKLGNIPDNLDHGMYLKQVCSKIVKLFVLYDLKEKTIKGGNAFFVAIRIMIVISLIVAFGYSIYYTPDIAAGLFGIDRFHAMELDAIEFGLGLIGYELDLAGHDIEILTDFGRQFVFYYRGFAIGVETYLVYVLMKLVQTNSYEENEQVYNELLEYIHEISMRLKGSLDNLLENITFSSFRDSEANKAKAIQDMRTDAMKKARDLMKIDINSRIGYLTTALQSCTKRAIEDVDKSKVDIVKYLENMKTHENLTKEASELLKSAKAIRDSDDEDSKNKLISDLSNTTKLIEDLEKSMEPAKKVIASGGGGRVNKRRKPEPEKLDDSPKASVPETSAAASVPETDDNKSILDSILPPRPPEDSA